MLDIDQMNTDEIERQECEEMRLALKNRKSCYECGDQGKTRKHKVLHKSVWGKAFACRNTDKLVVKTVDLCGFCVSHLDELDYIRNTDWSGPVLLED